MPSNTITQEDLLSALNNLREHVHDDIKNEILASEKRIDIRIDIKLEQQELRIDDRARRYNSNILARFDNWAGALERADQDREISTHKINELQEDVEEHENRISKLEKAQN